MIDCRSCVIVLQGGGVTVQDLLCAVRHTIDPKRYQPHANIRVEIELSAYGTTGGLLVKIIIRGQGEKGLIHCSGGLGGG